MRSGYTRGAVNVFISSKEEAVLRMIGGWRCSILLRSVDEYILFPGTMY